jgi:glycosyltransferase involved in cell wall biosynthesis
MRAVAGTNRPPLDGRDVVFIVPVTPAFTGNGLAMRAAGLLEAMHGEAASVHLVIIPAYEPRELTPSPAVLTYCRTCSRIPSPRSTFWSRLEDRWRKSGDPLWPAGTQALWRRRVEQVLSEFEEDLLVAFRLAAFSFLIPQRIERQPCWLDLDERDSAALRRRAALAAADGYPDEVERLNREASLVEKREGDLLGCPQWLSVASDVERCRLPESVGARAFVLPNVVRPRAPLPLRENNGGPFRCLFVGSFGYPPNVDAVAWFSRDILPLLRKLCALPVEFVIAGPDFDQRLSFLAGTANVQVLGWVDNLEPVYRETDIVVVPLRAGAGTRIKILEAFSFGRAVISTPVGAEGLPVTSGTELLIASDSESFAQAGATLLSDPIQQRQLAADAVAYVQREHSPASLRQALREGAVAGPVPLSSP